VSADSALALKVGATARIEATAAGADVTGDLTVSNDLAVTGDVSGATASGAMVSTDMLADKGSTTKVPRVAAVQEYSAVGMVNFNGTGTVSIRFNKNVTSITDNGTGDYAVNLTNAMADTNYVVVASSGNASTLVPLSGKTTSSFRVLTSNSGGTSVDSDNINVVVYGTLA
jgi:hypothetical protein